MAATVSDLNFIVTGDKRRTIGTITGDTSYPTGGYSITPNQMGLATVLLVDVENLLNTSSTTAIDAARYRISTNKLQIFSGSNEVANLTDVSAFQGRFEAIGW